MPFYQLWSVVLPYLITLYQIYINIKMNWVFFHFISLVILLLHSRSQFLGNEKEFKHNFMEVAQLLTMNLEQELNRQAIQCGTDA